MFCKVLVGSDEPSVYSRFIKLVKLHQARTLPLLGALYPGVKEMLKELRKMEFDLAILSNAHVDYIELVTETLGIADFFICLKGRSDESSKTARLADLSSDYDFTVMVGDRYHDIQAGLENSFPVIACSYGYGSAEEHYGAEIASSADEIAPLVEKLISR